MIEIGIKRYNNMIPINPPKFVLRKRIKVKKYIIKVHPTFLIALLGLLKFLIRKIKEIIAGRTAITPKRASPSPNPGQHSAFASGIYIKAITKSRITSFILFFMNIMLVSTLF